MAAAPGNDASAQLLNLVGSAQLSMEGAAVPPGRQVGSAGGLFVVFSRNPSRNPSRSRWQKYKNTRTDLQISLPSGGLGPCSWSRAAHAAQHSSSMQDPSALQEVDYTSPPKSSGFGSLPIV